MMTRAINELIRNHQPVTLSDTATVREACALMYRRRIGAVLVMSSSGDLTGIFTGRDAVRLLADGKEAAEVPLHSVMTPKPTTVSLTAKAIDALRLMQDGGFRHLPVMNGDRLVSIVSVGDFRAEEHDRLDEETGYWERL